MKRVQAWAGAHKGPLLGLVLWTCGLFLLRLTDELCFIAPCGAGLGLVAAHLSGLLRTPPGPERPL